MKTIFCKKCKRDVPIENFSLRLNNGKYSRYGKTCDECRKSKNKIKFSSEDFRQKNNIKQKNYYKKRFFYARAATIIGRIKKRKEKISYSTKELCKFLALSWKKQNGKCVLSGDKLTRENAEVDHIITKKNNGDNSFNNLRWITKDSNQIKGPLSDEDLKILIVKLYNKLILVNKEV